MSENFLSFIVNASPKAVDVGSDVPADTGRVASQGADFNSVLAKEQAKSQSPKTDAQPAAEADTASAAKPEVDAANAPSEAAADREAPVALPNAAANGNPLPELSIHSRALVPLPKLTAVVAHSPTPSRVRITASSKGEGKKADAA